MADQTTYLVDSDVLITAKNLYYAFDLCPGFWTNLLHYHGEGRVFSVDRVRNELLVGRGDEDLFQWVKNDVPEEFFLPVDTHEVARVYTEIMMWVQRHPNYFDSARAKFATGADGWLVACAQVCGATCRDERAACSGVQEGREAAGCLRRVQSPSAEYVRHASSAGSAVRLGGRG